jgi:3-dehydroquinate synthase
MLMRTIPLQLGYGVVLAPTFAGLGAHLDALDLPSVVVVTNPLVRSLHGASLAAELGQRVSSWVELPDGEAHKTLATWQQAVHGILESRPDRSTCVLAFGGGVVGDVAGFAAAACLRGLPLVQVPTTLLAMVDASVGGKTGVNVSVGKNLVGAFHQPRLVWAAQETLATLPPAELRCGLGEVLKHALLESEAALDELERLAPALRGGDLDAIARVVERSVRLKAAIVERDPREAGERAKLNLGHTLAHAIERCAGFGGWRHGEAVAVGVVAICRLAERRGWAKEGTLAERVARLAGTLGLPTRVPPEATDAELAEAMGFDKKRERGMVRLVIPTAPGCVELLAVPHTTLLELCAAGRGEP